MPLPALSSIPAATGSPAPTVGTLDPHRRHSFYRALAIPSLAVGVSILTLYVLVALVALQRDFGHLAILATNANLAASPVPPGPSMAHPFGEMSGIGVDEFSALLQATPWDLSIFGGVLLIGSSVGATLGAYAGLRPGPARATVSSVSELLVAIPPFFLVWVVVLNLDLAVAPGSFVAVFIGTFAGILCFGHARAVLGTARVVATEPFVEAARASGASDLRLLFRHILPNSLRGVWAQLPVDVFSVVFLLTAFPYVGCLDAVQLQTLGTFGYATPFPTVPFPEWGSLLASGACYGLNVVVPLATWWMWVFPLLALVGFAAAVTLVSEGLQQYSLLRR
jgi:peptide/nickel transport system permease protein